MSGVDGLREELLGVVEHAIAHQPRSLQTSIGPSELGIDCLRRIGHTLAGTPPVNTGGDRWLPTVGTAVHAWLAEVFDLLDPPGTPAAQRRWLVEEKVTTGVMAGVDVVGTCDLYDRLTATVVDHKVVGPTALSKYRTKGPGQQYRVQAHSYGQGWVNRGERVEHVAVMFLPRSGALRDAHLWTEPFDPTVAAAAHQRAGHVALLVADDPGSVALLPTADAFCVNCPWFAPGTTDLTRACPGDAATSAARRASASAPLEALIA
jgi:hypothetical protein